MIYDACQGSGHERMGNHRTVVIVSGRVCYCKLGSAKGFYMLKERQSRL